MRILTRPAWIRNGLLLLAVLLVPGCLEPDGTRAQRLPSAAQGQWSREELQDALADFDDLFTATVRQAAADIDNSSREPAVRKNTLLWQARMIPACHTAIEESDPLKAFGDLWTLSVRMRVFLTEGEGRQLFGNRQEVAVNAASQLDAEIERIGRRFLPADRFARIHDSVQAFAQARPLRTGFSNAVVRTTPAKGEGKELLAELVGIPLAPFRAMEGVDHGAQAIRGFTVVAGQFTDVVEQFPESVRWQLELMALEMEQSPVVDRFLQNADKLSASATSIAATAEKLPARLREEGTKLIDEIDARQAGLQQTLDRAEKVAATVERTIERVDAVAGTIDRTARSVTETGEAWQAMAKTVGETVKEVSGDKHPSTGPASTQPFDINDYRQTADSLTETARQLQQLTGQVRELVDSSKLSQHIQDVDSRTLAAVDQTATRVQGVTDHLIWRLGQLAAAVFALAVVYRLVSTRLPGKAK